MSQWRKILWPLVPLYALAAALRNKLFDLGILPEKSYATPLIVIGNLSTGGSGKTPLAEFLLENLMDFNPGFVSRGYGRQSKGLQMITSSDAASYIGDEPWQILQKYPGIKAAVAEKRTMGIEAVIASGKVGVIVLDDAFQHRHVSGDLNILLTTWQQPYFEDFLLPVGNLRESISGRKRADIILVTKCPESIDRAESRRFKERLKPGSRPVFFSCIKYDTPVNAFDEELPLDGRKINLITGIAGPEILVKKSKAHFDLVEHWDFGDHHQFTKEEIARFEASRNDIITTEKDWSRLKNRISEDLAHRLYRWPISMKILFDEEEEFIREVRKVFSRSKKE